MREKKLEKPRGCEKNIEVLRSVCGIKKSLPYPKILVKPPLTGSVTPLIVPFMNEDWSDLANNITATNATKILEFIDEQKWSNGKKMRALLLASEMAFRSIVDYDLHNLTSDEQPVKEFAQLYAQYGPTVVSVILYSLIGAIGSESEIK